MLPDFRSFKVTMAAQLCEVMPAYFDELDAYFKEKDIHHQPALEASMLVQ